ncbi:MAG: hypothetical protein IT193_08005 [Propionibacteriaceae bacterium]|nr:hypothetical protein [Propionibacteriaceae bacterium]
MPDQINATRIMLRTLRLLDDGRRAVAEQWEKLTGTAATKRPEPPADRRQPPDIW